MHSILNRRSRVLQIAAAMFALIALTNAARADIFQWEYINPADPSQGKRQSSMLVPDGSGVNAVPGADLSNRYLTMAYLSGANLMNASIVSSNLDHAELSGADLSGANLTAATLTGANLTGANLHGASLATYFPFPNPTRPIPVSVITADQLYSTASYLGRELSGIDFGGNDLVGVNFAGQNLTNSSFFGASLGYANFTAADIRGAAFGSVTLLPVDRDFPIYKFYGGGISLAQLYSTASYLAKDLSGIAIASGDFGGADFSGQNLSGAFFGGSLPTRLDRADFRGANLANATFWGAYLNSADFRQMQPTDVQHQVVFRNSFLDGAKFAGQDLTGVSFRESWISGADFTGAIIQGADFSVGDSYNHLNEFGQLGGLSPAGSGIAPAQLYSTASYRARDLRGINFTYNGLASASFAGQNLANSNFYRAILTGADFSAANLTNTSFEWATLTRSDFSGADARGAYGLNVLGAITTNLIRPDGHVDGLDLGADRLLFVGDYDGDSRYNPARPPIQVTVEQHFAMGSGGVLQMVFDADHWDSRISFAPGIPVTLGGVLELTYAPDVNLAGEIGRTIDLFDWTGVNPTGAFTVTSPYTWDLTKLYTTGEVTLTAVPEPAGLALAMAGFFSLDFYRRRKTP